MNEIRRDLVPAMLDHDPKRITPVRALTKCDGRTDGQGVLIRAARRS